MGDQFAGFIIGVGKTLAKALLHVKKNKQDAKDIQDLIKLVNDVCNDMTLVHNDRRRVGRDSKLTLAMMHLNDALEEAEREVGVCLKHNIMMQTVKVSVTADKLRRLRTQIEDAMRVTQLASLDEINRDGKIRKDMLEDLGSRLDDFMSEYRRDRKNKEVVVRKQQEQEQYRVILTRIQLRERQEEVTRHLNWAEDQWFKDEDKDVSSLHDVSGGPCKVVRERKCDFCVTVGTAISAGCSHYYCNQCWRDYISEAVRHKGIQECLSLRCLQAALHTSASCKMPVIKELVDMVELDDEVRDNYAKFASWSSYVDDSGGRIKCTG